MKQLEIEFKEMNDLDRAINLSLPMRGCSLTTCADYYTVAFSLHGVTVETRLRKKFILERCSHLTSLNLRREFVNVVKSAVYDRFLGSVSDEDVYASNMSFFYRHLGTSRALALFNDIKERQKEVGGTFNTREVLSIINVIDPVKDINKQLKKKSRRKKNPFNGSPDYETFDRDILEAVMEEVHRPDRPDRPAEVQEREPLVRESSTRLRPVTTTDASGDQWVYFENVQMHRGNDTYDPEENTDIF